MGMSALLDELVLYVYRMSGLTVALLAALAVLSFCVVFRRNAGKRWMHLSIGVLLAAWFCAAVWMTVLGRSGGGDYRTSWIPLDTYWRVWQGEDRELLRSAGMNAVLFFPAGLLMGSMLPEKWSFWEQLLWIGAIFMLLSCSIELSQYILCRGNAEMDDVLHNTLGALLGLTAFRAGWSFPRRKRSEKRNK